MSHSLEPNNIIILFLVFNTFVLLLLQRSERAEGVTVEAQVAYVVGKVGPSMMLTSLSESLAFFLGKLRYLQYSHIRSYCLISHSKREGWLIGIDKNVERSNC